MNRITSITTSLKDITANGVGKFSTLDLTSQLRVMNSRIWTIKSNSFWLDILNDEETDPVFRKRAVAEVNIRNRCIDSMLPVIKAASHFTDDGVFSEVKRDAGFVDEEGNEVDDIAYDTEVVAGHPHAWVAAGLTKSFGIDFDQVTADHNQTVFLFEVEKTYRKAAAQYAATLTLIQAGIYRPSKSDNAQHKAASMIQIAACSSTLHGLMGMPTKAQHRGVFELFDSFESFPFTYTSFVKDVKEPVIHTYNAEKLKAVWNDLVEQDVEEAEQQQLKAEALDHKRHLAELKASLLAVTRKAETTHVAVSMATAGAAQLKAIGITDASIASMFGPILQQALGLPPASAQPPVQIEDEDYAQYQAWRKEREFEDSLQAAEEAAALEAAAEAEALAKQAKRAALQAAQPPAPPTTTPKSLLDTLTDKVEEMEFHQRVAEKSAARAAKAAGRKRSLAEQLAAT